MTLDELKATLDAFSPVKIEFVARVMESLANPPSANIRSRGTWLTGEPDWIEYFGLALSVHHGATTEPLGLSSFETVFRNACEHLHWSTDPPGSRTQRFVDMVVLPKPGNRRRLSLKSTAAKNLSTTALHISKLTEAAWIQDARTAREIVGTVHLNCSDSTRVPLLRSSCSERFGKTLTRSRKSTSLLRFQ